VLVYKWELSNKRELRVLVYKWELSNKWELRVLVYKWELSNKWELRVLVYKWELSNKRELRVLVYKWELSNKQELVRNLVYMRTFSPQKQRLHPHLKKIIYCNVCPAYLQQNYPATSDTINILTT
jgi:hypothetical protein